MQLNNSFVMRNIYGKHILMPIRRNNASNDPVLLNDVAYAIWKAVPNHAKKKDVLNQIAQEYGLEPNSAEFITVDSFISQMVSMGLVIETTEGE